MQTKVTIIGFGTMGKAIAKAVLENGKNIEIFPIEKGKSLENISTANFLILAVKPKDIQELATQIKGKINKKSIIISILAGTNIKTLSNLLGSKKIVRTMPNLGLSVDAGIAVWKSNTGLTSEEYSSVKKFLDLICENIEVKDEKMIDAATAISGSGPAYFFLLADAMLKAAKKLKLDDATACKLVSKTLLASAVLSNNNEYKDLIKRIASKKGTTEAALEVFKKEHFESTVAKAVKAAHKRAVQISKGK